MFHATTALAYVQQYKKRQDMLRGMNWIQIVELMIYLFYCD